MKLNFLKSSLVFITLILANSAFAQNPKSSDAGPGGTAGGGTNISGTGINTGNLGTSSIGTTTNMTRGNTSGEGAGTTPNGKGSTNGYRASSTAGMDRTTSTSNKLRKNKKNSNSPQTTSTPKEN